MPDEFGPERECIAAVLVAELGTAYLGRIDVYERERGEVEFDEIVDVVGVELEIQFVAIARTVADAELVLVCDLGIEVRTREMRLWICRGDWRRL